MSILKIRDANGNIQEILAIKGENYVLTDKDKQEIANMISGGGSGGSGNSPIFKEVTEEENNNLEYTDETRKSMLYLQIDTEDPFLYGLVHSFGNDTYGVLSQVAIGEDGLIYVRNELDNFAEWHCVNDERYTRKIDFENLVEDLESYHQSDSDIHSDFLNRIESNSNRISELEKIDTSKFVTEVDVIRLINENLAANVAVDGDEEYY